MSCANADILYLCLSSGTQLDPSSMWRMQIIEVEMPAEFVLCPFFFSLDLIKTQPQKVER